jgi:hypothetical protein
MRRRKLRWVVATGLLALVAVGALVLLHRPDRVTEKNFKRITDGMSRAEVEAILGPPNVSEAEVDRLATLDGFSGEVSIIGLSGGQLRFDGRKAEENLFWAGGAGLVCVGFADGHVVDGGMLPRAGIVERIERRWRRWFPEKP